MPGVVVVPRPTRPQADGMLLGSRVRSRERPDLMLLDPDVINRCFTTTFLAFTGVAIKLYYQAPLDCPSRCRSIDFEKNENSSGKYIALEKELHRNGNCVESNSMKF